MLSNRGGSSGGSSGEGRQQLTAWQVGWALCLPMLLLLVAVAVVRVCWGGRPALACTDYAPHTSTSLDPPYQQPSVQVCRHLDAQEGARSFASHHHHPATYPINPLYHRWRCRSAASCTRRRAHAASPEAWAPVWLPCLPAALSRGEGATSLRLQFRRHGCPPSPPFLLSSWGMSTLLPPTTHPPTNLLSRLTYESVKRWLARHPEGQAHGQQQLIQPPSQQQRLKGQQRQERQQLAGGLHVRPEESPAAAAD